jgi:hypothetical protein
MRQKRHRSGSAPGYPGVPGLAPWRRAIAGAGLVAIGWVPVASADGGDLQSALVDDSKVYVHLRSYYFDRDKPDDTRSSAWAIGGWAGYESGWIADLLGFGVVGYTSLPLWAPDDKDGTLLLKPGQDGYAAVGQAYVSLKFGEHVFKGYRQLINQPEVNPQDNRMTPNTFEGYTLGGKWRDLTYLAGYLTKEKERNSDKFRDLAQVAGAPEGVSEDMWMGGVEWAPAKDQLYRLSAYRVPDILQSYYADGSALLPLAGELRLRLSGQYMTQRSSGDNLLTGSSFDTWSAGVKADLIRGPATFSIAYTQTGDGDNYRSPYGSWAGYTSMIVKDFNRAGEQAWLLGGAYDFGVHGLTGFSVNAYVVHGTDAIDPASGAGTSDNTEYDLTLDYRFSAESWPAWIRPLWLRARAVRVEEDFGDRTAVTKDYRVIANYLWTFK